MDKGAPGVPQTESGGQASLGPNSRRNIWPTTKIRLLTPDKEDSARKDGSMELMRVKKVGLGILQVNKQEKV